MCSRLTNPLNDPRLGVLSACLHAAVRYQLHVLLSLASLYSHMKNALIWGLFCCGSMVEKWNKGKLLLCCPLEVWNLCSLLYIIIRTWHLSPRQQSRGLAEIKACLSPLALTIYNSALLGSLQLISGQVMFWERRLCLVPDCYSTALDGAVRDLCSNTAINRRCTLHLGGTVAIPQRT